MDMYLMEFFGTFCLNLAISMHPNGKLHQADQPYAVLMVIVMIVAIGAPISGAHYNPNLTLAFWLSGDRKARGPRSHGAAIASATPRVHPPRATAPTRSRPASPCTP